MSGEVNIIRGLLQKPGYRPFPLPLSEDESAEPKSLTMRSRRPVYPFGHATRAEAEVRPEQRLWRGFHCLKVEELLRHPNPPIDKNALYPALVWV